MMVRRVWANLFVAVAAGSSLWIAGCASTAANEKKEPNVFVESPDGVDPGLAVANSYAHDFFTALRENDYEKFHQLMAGEALESFTPAHFERFRAELDAIGKMREPEYLGMLDNTTYRDYLWKVVFEADGGVRKSGIFFFRLVRDKENAVVAGIQFKRF